MITKIKSSKTAALKLSMGIIITAALLVIFAFDNEQNQVQNKKTSEKQAKIVATEQQKSSTADEQIFLKVEQMPVFPGGDKAFGEFITNELKYPDDARKAGTHGKVFVVFIVNKEGNVVNPKIARGVSPSIDKEALRVIRNSPKWTPGKQRGKNVDVQFTIPIAFVNDEQKSQQTDEQVFIVVDQMPVFPGGDKALGEFIGKEVKYPDDAKKAGTQGKVILTFIINKEGNVVNPKIVRGVSPSIDKEALRVISNSPKWTPGKQKGKNVDVKFTLPIAFTL